MNGAEGTPRRFALRGVAVAAAVLVLLTAAAVWTAPDRLQYVPQAPVPGADLDAWLAESEAAAGRIVDGAEKRLRWYENLIGRRSDYVVVYLHGFSATRQEIAPVPELVADALAANLFETRLAGHGLAEAALNDVRAEDWLDDGAESLAIAAAIGERIVLIGTSTGATLALALADHALFQRVDSVILLSPNLGPSDPSSEWLLRPAGPLLARAMVGEYRSWAPANEQQARYWSTRYPTAALVEMMRLVGLVRARLPLDLAQPLLTVYSPDDLVVDVDRIRALEDAISAPRETFLPLQATGDPGRHVIAGDILNAGNNERVAALIVRFVRGADL